ncbi:Osmotin thaumatin-like protein [Coniophora puteana RWD-64-598 SS2]|uniref:Osmotin thaumatin-like protein n=1 Tax=Coniophora puteana (strain RWD-64-598) TaxID=741705 RepID=A0A5M3N015_CONPW|nr:Osmotin thaumatin-like protein [Coniophora puteana RWD-64-598 SS2]EIW84245.1 Osmotin thaumatin-like protein [Coniophora puteana RWD-64-598 SS2]
MSAFRALSIAAIAAVASAQSVNVVNKCSDAVTLFTQSSFGTIDNNVNVAAGATNDMHISSDWDGAINVGTGCNGNTCTTGGPTWDGQTPFSRAEFNFNAVPGSVTYDISLIYGYNVGMEISSADSGCSAFACTLPSGCPVTGPDNSCFSPCCSSSDACSGGALPASNGGCVSNAGPGPNSPFYYKSCTNAYAFPDNDGAAGYTPADNVDFTCGNTAITLTLCPGTTSNIPK